MVCRWQRYRAGNELLAAEEVLKSRHVEAFVHFCTDEARSTDGDDEWRSLTVAGFPSKYVFVDGEWRRRRNQRTAVGRMYAVHPNKGDTFYLRTLLCYLTGSDVRQLFDTCMDNLEPCVVCMTKPRDSKVLPCGHDHFFLGNETLLYHVGRL